MFLFGETWGGGGKVGWGGGEGGGEGVRRYRLGGLPE